MSPNFETTSQGQSAYIDALTDALKAAGAPAAEIEEARREACRDAGIDPGPCQVCKGKGAIPQSAGPTGSRYTACPVCAPTSTHASTPSA